MDEIKKLKDKTRRLLGEWGVSDEEADEFMQQLEDTADKNDDGTIADDIEKAKDDVEKKGEDTQTEKDRVDESVGEQIEEKGDGDSQSAKNRVDESDGEEKAEEGNAPDGGPSLSDMDEVEEPAKETSEEKKKEAKEEPKLEQPDKFDVLAGKIDQLIGSVAQLVSSMSKSTDPDAQALESAKARYGVNPGVFQDDGKDNGKEITDGREAKAVFRTQR